MPNPQEANDSEGRDITDEALQKTKFRKMPTVASVMSPTGSILSQLKQVDPQNMTAVLKKSVDNMMKINDMGNFSSGAGVSNILGQVLGQAMNAVGASKAVEQLASNVPDASKMTINAQLTLLSALQNLGPTPNSDVVSQIIGDTLQPMLQDLLNLINSGNLTLQTFEDLIAKYFNMIKANGANATVGANQDNILGMLSSIIPQLAEPIQSTLQDHLPPSVLDQSKITEALKKFSMSQAYIKKPDTGKKALAMKAVQQTPDTTSLFSGGLSGLTDQAKTFISSINPFTN
jgi:hypothetical protein